MVKIRQHSPGHCGHPRLRGTSKYAAKWRMRDHIVKRDDRRPETRRLDYVNAPYSKKKQFVRAKMIPKGFFGCETSPINEG